MLSTRTNDVLGWIYDNGSVRLSFQVAICVAIICFIVLSIEWLFNVICLECLAVAWKTVVRARGNVLDIEIRGARLEILISKQFEFCSGVDAFLDKLPKVELVLRDSPGLVSLIKICRTQRMRQSQHIKFTDVLICECQRWHTWSGLKKLP